MLDHDVACKFCNTQFRAWSSLTKIAPGGSPGEHPAVRPPRTPPLAALLGLEQGCGGSPRPDRGGVVALEQAIVDVLNEQKTLKIAMERIQRQNQSLVETERDDVATLRTELKRVEASHTAVFRASLRAREDFPPLASPG